MGKRFSSHELGMNPFFSACLDGPTLCILNEAQESLRWRHKRGKTPFSSPYRHFPQNCPEQGELFSLFCSLHKPSCSQFSSISSSSTDGCPGCQGAESFFAFFRPFLRDLRLTVGLFSKTNELGQTLLSCVPELWQRGIGDLIFCGILKLEGRIMGLTAAAAAFLTWPPSPCPRGWDKVRFREDLVWLGRFENSESWLVSRMFVPTHWLVRTCPGGDSEQCPRRSGTCWHPSYSSMLGIPWPSRTARSGDFIKLEGSRSTRP